MITYTCDGCDAIMDQKEYEKKQNIIENKVYCNKCKPKVNTIVGDLTAQKNIKKADVDTWYATEKAAQIAAQCK